MGDGGSHVHRGRLQSTVYRLADLFCSMCIVMYLLIQVMHRVVMPHFDVDKPEGERTYIYGCENDHG